MKLPPALKKRVAPLAMLLLFVLMLFSFWNSQRGPLKIVSSNPQITVSATHCTVGTNHVYFFGNLRERFLYPLDRWVGHSNAHHARFRSATTNTVIWVRFANNATPAPPPGAPASMLPNLFTAQIIDSDGRASNLSLAITIQHHQRQFHIAGWALNGLLDDHPNAKIRIQDTNGTEAVTFQVRQSSPF